MAQLLPLGDGVWRLIGRHGKDLVLKRCGPAERWFYRRFGGTAFGAPRCLGLIRAPGGGGWLLLEALPEHYPDLSDPAAVAAVYRHLGAIHRRTVGLRGPAPPGFPAPAQVAALVGPEPAALLAAGPRVLLHGDYHRWNLVVAGGRIRVLDWGRATIGHPIWDLALLSAPVPGSSDGPPAALTEQALRAYHRAGPLAHLDWPSFHRLHLATAAALCRQRAAAYAAAAARVGGGLAEPVRAQAAAEEARAEALLALART